MMKLNFNSILIVLFLFGTKSVCCQETLIVEDVIIDWQDYPRLFSNKEMTQFKGKFEMFQEIEMHHITYLSDGLKIESFAAIPKGQEKLPVIIFNRGGNRDFGSLQLFGGENRVPAAFFFSRMASKGFIVIGCNFRGGGLSEGKDEFGGDDVNDVLNLIKVLDEIPRADTDNIGMYGWSRGGMMTYLALTETEKVKAAAVGGAISDLTEIYREEMETNVYAELIPNYWENKEEALKSRSALYFAEKFSPEVPILILHGSSDWRVKADNSLRLALKFEELRIPYRLKIYEGGDHGISEFRDDVDEEVMNWFKRFLVEDESLPEMDYHGK